MINVMDLLSLPQFNNFKLLTNSKGLFNVVLGTGIWEWESPEIIEETFCPGEFVFTVLGALKNSREDAYEGLRALIRKKVAAIAIKSVYFDTCPEEIVELANRHRVPIFMFSGSYIDDLIYVVKNAVLSNDSNNIMLNHLRELMDGRNDGDAVGYAKKLNPLFFDNLVCFCCLGQGPSTAEQLDQALVDYRNSISSEQISPEARYSLIRCNNCIIIIYTVEEGERLEKHSGSMTAILGSFISNIDSFHVGVSNVKLSLAEIRQAIDEAVVASLSAVLENEPCRRYDEIGADAFLLANIENQHFIEFYRKTYKCLSAYDDTHSSDLLKTLICYMESEGDINLTSKRLYQHNNTVRYRLDKIKKLLSMTGSIDTEVQFYVFVRIHKLELEHLLYKETII